MQTRINQKCLVRHQDCKRIFEGSRICFIASPSGDETALELEVIQQKLRDVHIEPYIAVEKHEYQKDIFCEKICSKIIESKFCIVVLNDVDEAGSMKIPNANVYYEYGLMTAFGKKIIPIQLEGQSLAFNIQSLDTVKYTGSSLGRQIEEAIKPILLYIEGEEGEENENVSVSSNIEWTLDIMGLANCSVVYPHLEIRSLGFSLYKYIRDERLVFVGVFGIGTSDREIVLNSKILTVRIKNSCEHLSHNIGEIEEDKWSDSIRSMLIEKEVLAKKMLEKATILILKNSVGGIEDIKNEYEERCKDIEFSLDIEIIDIEKAKDIVGGHGFMT